VNSNIAKPRHDTASCLMTNIVETAHPSALPDNRDPVAIEEVFEAYRDKLSRTVALRLDPRVLSKADGEDVLQDVFMEASRRYGAYLNQPTVPVFVWLRQLAIQAVIDTHRRYLGAQMRAVTSEVPLYQAGTGSAMLAVQLADSLTSPSQHAVREETLLEIQAALAQLSETDREVLVLRHLEDLSNNEVAEVLGIDKYAASKRYLRALERLRAVLPMEDGP